MWNERPFNSDMPDPFGRNPDRSGEGKYSAESVKCPSCASNIFFQPELKGMVCRNCGNIYKPSTLEKIGSLGYSIEHDYTSDSELSEDDKKRHEITCDSCGAVMIADENMMSTMCPFCGSLAIITGKLTREFKPDYIIPFKIDRQTAEKSIKEWLNTRKMTPAGFKSKSRLTKMTAFYVPFWVVDCCVNSELYGFGVKKKGDNDSASQVHSTIAYYVKNVPFDASLKIANKLMVAIEPFDFSEMVKFDNKYLQGFFADKYDQRPTEIMERFVKRMEGFSSEMHGKIANKYDEYKAKEEKTFTWMSDINIKYCLLPVWFMNVEFDGRQYQFAVNGQTGEASGQAPITSAADKLESIVRFTNGNWMKIPYVLSVVVPVLLGLIAFSLNTSPLYLFLFMALIVLEVLLIALIISVFVIRGIANKASRTIHGTADVVNDFDKDPGLDEYYDTEHRTELEVEDYLMYHDGQYVNDRVDL